MDFLTQYHVKIKEKLAKIMDNYDKMGFSINFERLSDVMKTEYNLDVSAQKLRAMFDIQNTSRKLQLAELAAVCDILGISLNELCQFPSSPVRELNPSWLDPKDDEHKSKIPHILDNRFFYGKYYCYYYKQRPLSGAKLGKKFAAKETPIYCAELNIYEKNGFSYAAMTESFTSQNFDMTHPMESFTYEGKVYLLDNPNQVYMMLMDKGGSHFMCIVFDYQNYTKDVMYYRSAALLTSGTSTKKPLLEKIIILRQKLDLSNKKHLEMLRGMLTLNAHKISIRKSVFEDLCKEYPNLNTIPRTEESYIVFNEMEILNHNSDMEYNDKKNSILVLRQNSELPIQCLIDEDGDFHEMVKEFQQSLMKREE